MLLLTVDLLFGMLLQIPTFGFLYVAGWIGYVGRLYLNAVRRYVLCWASSGLGRGQKSSGLVLLIMQVSAGDSSCSRMLLAKQLCSHPVSKLCSSLVQLLQLFHQHSSGLVATMGDIAVCADLGMSCVCCYVHLQRGQAY